MPLVFDPLMGWVEQATLPPPQPYRESAFGPNTWYLSPKNLDENAATSKTVNGNEVGLTVARPGDAVPYVFGRTLVTPIIIGVEEYLGNLFVNYLYSKGECEEFEYLLQGGEDVGLPDNNEYFLGTASQSKSTLMVTAKGDYDTLDGYCHVVANLDPGTSLDQKAVMKGMKLYDPRSSPQTAYSTNPALALATAFTACGYTVDGTSLTAAANYCDEIVGTSSPGETRWEIGLPIFNRNTLRSWARTLATYANCLIDIQGGTVYLVPHKKVTSSPQADHTITKDDCNGPLRVVKRGVRGVPKKVIAYYREPTGENRSAETATSGSTGEISRLQLPGFPTYTMAKRFAVETYNKAQDDLEVQLTTHETGIKPTIGDLGLITHDNYGLAGKLMRVISAREVAIGRWRVGYREYSDAAFDDSLYAAPTGGDTNLPDPNNPPTGPTPTVVEEIFTDETATTYSRLKITFTGVTWGYCTGYRVTCNGEQNVLETIIAHQGAVTHTVYTAALKQGVNYTINVYAVSRTGALSATPGTASSTALGKLLPPGDVPSLTAFEAGTLVSMSWGAAEEITGDLRGYIIKRIPAANYVGTSADWTHTNTVTLADRVDATTYLTTAQPAGDWYYGVKAIDNAGNESTNATWAAVTVTASAGSSNTTFLDSGAVTNMRVFTIDGDAKYAVTDGGILWEDLFPAASPLMTWEDVYGVNDTWESQEQSDSEFNTEVWDVGSLKQGNWYWSDQDITVWGGGQTNITRLGDASSPIGYVNHSGNAVQASAQHLISQVSVDSATSPITLGDGFGIKLPVSVSFSGAILNQSGTSTISASSPLDNPKSVTFTTAYSSPPEVSAVLKGSTAKIIAIDNITTTGFDWYCWTTSGAKTDGEIDWQSTGT